MQHIISRPRAIKFVIIVIIAILTTLLFINDSSLFSVTSRRLQTSCVLCPLKENISFDNYTKIFHFRVFVTESASDVIDVLLFFAHVNENPNLKIKLGITLSSLFKYATTAVHLHLLTDNSSLNYAIQILRNTAHFAKTSIQVSLYNVNDLLKPLQNLIDSIRPYFSYKQGAYYSDGLFYISIGLFKVLPLRRVIIIDADVKFLDDINNLYKYFENFPPEAIAGLAEEQQPVYRHVLHEYRRISNSSIIGGPPPNGMPGFNSGVLLLDLEKMKNSVIYNSILNNSLAFLNLIKKYKFKGHLGDQDFYTLLNFEHPELFYTLPCSWNRQLCQWWKHHGYNDIFEAYHSCNETIHLFHGNCNSFIPDTLDLKAS